MRFDATLQNPIIDAVVASGPDAILVAPNDVEASAGPLQRAQEAGIEVILVDTTVNDESIGRSRIASDNLQGGVTAADALAELIGEEGKVMVISVNPGISSTDARQAGFEEQIATYPDIEYIGTEFSNNEPARPPRSSRRRWPPTLTSTASSPPTCSRPRARPPDSSRPAPRKTCRSSASTPGRPRSSSSRPATSRRSSSRSPTTSASRASSRPSPR